MHELGILKQVAAVVEQVASKNKIEIIRFITLEVGSESGIVPYYMKKLLPVAADLFPLLKNTELIINVVCGKGLAIKEIGY